MARALDVVPTIVALRAELETQADCEKNGSYAKRFILEGQSNYPEMTAWRRNNAAHQIEVLGGELRAMVPWIAANNLVDHTKN